MTEPTDAELDELRQANSGRLNFVTLSEFRTIARAVLEKWGTLPAVMGEPVGYCHEIKWRAHQSEQVQKITRKAHPEYGYTQALYTTPQPTQTQAGAVPLTPEAINVMAREYPAEDLCGWSYRMGVADAEAHHGIKGGQHGTE